MLIALKGHFFTHIPHPIHNLSDMKAIFDSGVTSIQSLPVRTTGQDFLHSWRHFYVSGQHCDWQQDRHYYSGPLVCTARISNISKWLYFCGECSTVPCRCSQLQFWWECQPRWNEEYAELCCNLPSQLVRHDDHKALWSVVTSGKEQCDRQNSLGLVLAILG